MTLLNTSFFYLPSMAQGVHTALRTEWLPACRSCGTSEPICLKMPAESNVERLAIHTTFADKAEAENFLQEVLNPLGAQLARTFGPEAFSCFSTIMEVVEL